MKIEELMTKEPASCRPEESLNAAARIMWEHDCGCVPVTGESSRLVGMLTDRDICMAAYFENRPLSEIPVSEAMSKRIQACRPDDPIAAAETTMQENQIRRLPVIDADGRLLGIVSLADIAREAELERARKKRREVKEEDVARTLAAISRPRDAASEAAAAG